MRLSAAILLCTSALFLAVEGQLIGAITGLTAAQATIAGLAGHFGRFYVFFFLFPGLIDFLL